MQQFLIGMYGGFDEGKYERDFREGFYGIEACLFATDADVARLAAESGRRGFRVGIHFPFRQSGTQLRDALFLARDDRVRHAAMEYILRQAEGLAKVQPEYVLFHYPKPVILDDRVGWELWKFADPSEYVWESRYSCAELKEGSEQLFAWLHARAVEYGFTPVLELDALNRYVYEEESFLPALLDRYPSIRLCLDTGRLHLQERIDPHFDARSVLKTYGKYAKMIHLWNMRITDQLEYSRYPVLPACKPEDGWAPIADYLQIIREENPEVLVMFEHRSEWVTDRQLQECYQWVDSLMNPQ